MSHTHQTTIKKKDPSVLYLNKCEYAKPGKTDTLIMSATNYDMCTQYTFLSANFCWKSEIKFGFVVQNRVNKFKYNLLLKQIYCHFIMAISSQKISYGEQKLNSPKILEKGFEAL